MPRAAQGLRSLSGTSHFRLTIYILSPLEAGTTTRRTGDYEPC